MSRIGALKLVGLIATILVCVQTASSQPTAKRDPRDPIPDGKGLERILDRDAVPELIASGHKLADGAIWIDGRKAQEPGFLLYADGAEDKIYRLDPYKPNASPEVWLTPTSQAGGLTLDASGNVLISMQNAGIGRRYAYAEPQTPVEVLCDRVGRIKFAAPRDLVLADNGSIYFGDLPLDRIKGITVPRGHCAIYRLDRDFVAHPQGMVMPLGVALSPDHRTLYITEHGSEGRIVACKIGTNGDLGRSSEFASNTLVKGHHRHSPVGGVRVDTEGNVYVAGVRGVWVYEPDSTFLGVIRLPDSKSARNLCFGGTDLRTLFITAGDSVYSVPVKIAGLRPGRGITGKPEQPPSKPRVEPPTAPSNTPGSLPGKP